MRVGAFRLAFLLALAVVPGPECRAGGWRGGVGVLGDSYSDEYQFYPPHRTQARNWVEILAETRGLDFGSFSRADRGAPRHGGYAFNWARSGATTADALAQGQHTGLAAQVARGEVGLVWVFLGGNDFIEALRSPDPEANLPRAADQAIANLDRILATLRAADSSMPILLATVPDVLELPEFAGPLRQGSLPRPHAAAATAALLRYNEHIRSWPRRDARVFVVDLFLSQQVSRIMAPESLKLGGIRISREVAGDAYDHLFLADGRHAGTVAQALIARLFVATVNARLDAGIRPLSDREILEYAARVPSTPGSLAGGPELLGATPAP
jgi:lysophospholipase L1-like esterase